MNHPAISQVVPDTKEHLRKLSTAYNSMLMGRLNAISTVILTANAATTTLTDSRLTVDCFIGFMPKTAHAATELATLYVDTQNTGSAVIHHANNAQTDRSFTILIIG